jgi:hypothetical protein
MNIVVEDTMEFRGEKQAPEPIGMTVREEVDACGR